MRPPPPGSFEMQSEFVGQKVEGLADVDLGIQGLVLYFVYCTTFDSG